MTSTIPKYMNKGSNNRADTYNIILMNDIFKLQVEHFVRMAAFCQHVCYSLISTLFGPVQKIADEKLQLEQKINKKRWWLTSFTFCIWLFEFLGHYVLSFFILLQLCLQAKQAIGNQNGDLGKWFLLIFRCSRQAWWWSWIHDKEVVMNHTVPVYLIKKPPFKCYFLLLHPLDHGICALHFPRVICNWTKTSSLIPQ